MAAWRRGNGVAAWRRGGVAARLCTPLCAALAACELARQATERTCVDDVSYTTSSVVAPMAAADLVLPVVLEPVCVTTVFAGTAALSAGTVNDAYPLELPPLAYHVVASAKLPAASAFSISAWSMSSALWSVTFEPGA